jgi:signal transduction histidine kinase
MSSWPSGARVAQSAGADAQCHRHLNTRAPDAPEWELRARNTISHHLDHMVRLVDDLLDVSRLSHNKLALQLRKTWWPK